MTLLHAMILQRIALCIPTIIVTVLFNFVPWGLITAAITLALYAVVLFLPNKTLIRANVDVVLESLSYGRLDDAKDHISIAIREAENAVNLDRSDVDDLCAACEKVAASLNGVGQTDVARSLREQCSKIASRFS